MTATSRWAVVIVESVGECALRAELAEVRAVNAELRRGQVLLAEQVRALGESRDRLCRGEPAAAGAGGRAGAAAGAESAQLRSAAVERGLCQAGAALAAAAHRAPLR